MHKRGFTLLEVVIVVAVAMILATMAAVYMGKSRAQARLARVSSELQTIASALTQYAEDNSYQYPPESEGSVPPALARYLADGAVPAGPWPYGYYDWDNWTHPTTDEQIYQVSYRLCGAGDPAESCQDPKLFPQFTVQSSIFSCISGPCIPSLENPSAPAYCVNCTPKEQNYTP